MYQVTIATGELTAEQEEATGLVRIFVVQALGLIVVCVVGTGPCLRGFGCQGGWHTANAACEESLVMPALERSVLQLRQTELDQCTSFSLQNRHIHR